MDGVSYLLLLGVLAVIPAKIAEGKGRDFWGWWFYGLALWPVAVIHAAALQEGPDPQITKGTHRSCPFCAEPIRQEAVVCRYCGRDVPKVESVAATPAPVVDLPCADKRRFDPCRPPVRMSEDGLPRCEYHTLHPRKR